MLAKTQGIVLRETRYRDQSKICALYTRDFGRLSVILKGGRNPKNRLSGIFSTGNLLEVVFYRKEHHDIQLISEGRIIRSPMSAEPSLDIVRHATGHEGRNVRLFDTLAATLEKLCSPCRDFDIVLSWFLLRLIVDLGFEPSLDRCLATGRRIMPLVRTGTAGNLTMLYEPGGVAITENAPADGPDRQPLPLPAYLLMTALRNIDIRAIDTLEPSGATGKQLRDILQNYFARHSEYEPRSKNRRILSQILSDPGQGERDDVKKQK